MKVTISRTSSPLHIAVGTALIGHFTFTLARSLYGGTPEDALWISHVGTLVGGLGACLRNRRLIWLALVTCFGHHAFWIFDTLSWWLTGEFAVGATAYLKDYNLGGWIQASNHFFTVPALLLLATLGGSVEKHAWFGSSALFLLLTMTSLFFLPPTSNVNCAHAPWPGLETFVAVFVPLNPVSPAKYMLFITAATVIGNYLPANLALAFIVPKFNELLTKRSARFPTAAPRGH